MGKIKLVMWWSKHLDSLKGNLKKKENNITKQEKLQEKIDKIGN